MTRGGTRQGAGRPKVAPLSGETIVIRVPRAYADQIRKAIAKWDDEKTEF